MPNFFGEGMNPLAMGKTPNTTGQARIIKQVRAERREKTILAQNLERIRMGRGLSQRDLSLRAGLNETAVKAIETGKSESPRENTLRALAKILDCEVSDLIKVDTQAAVAVAPSSIYGARIEAARIAQGLAIDQFARNLGISVQLLALWESGEVTPDSTGLARLWRAGVPSDWILHGDQDALQRVRQR